MVSVDGPNTPCHPFHKRNTLLVNDGDVLHSVLRTRSEDKSLFSRIRCIAFGADGENLSVQDLSATEKDINLLRIF